MPGNPFGAQATIPQNQPSVPFSGPSTPPPTGANGIAGAFQGVNPARAGYDVGTAAIMANQSAWGSQNQAPAQYMRGMMDGLRGQPPMYGGQQTQDGYNPFASNNTQTMPMRFAAGGVTAASPTAAPAGRRAMTNPYSKPTAKTITAGSPSASTPTSSFGATTAVDPMLAHVDSPPVPSSFITAGSPISYTPTVDFMGMPSQSGFIGDVPGDPTRAYAYTPPTFDALPMGGAATPAPVQPAPVQPAVASTTPLADQFRGVPISRLPPPIRQVIADEAMRNQAMLAASRASSIAEFFNRGAPTQVAQASQSVATPTPVDDYAPLGGMDYVAPTPITASSTPIADRFRTPTPVDDYAPLGGMDYVAPTPITASSTPIADRFRNMPFNMLPPAIRKAIADEAMRNRILANQAQAATLVRPTVTTAPTVVATPTLTPTPNQTSLRNVMSGPTESTPKKLYLPRRSKA